LDRVLRRVGVQSMESCFCTVT